jgi:hypothetical protein
MLAMKYAREGVDMKQLIAFLALLCGSAHAFESFLDNPITPYPPGCATTPDVQFETHPQNWNIVVSERISLVSGIDPRERMDVDFSVARVACAEPDRSIVWLMFDIPNNVDPVEAVYLTPEVRIVVDGEEYRMRISPEPSTWGSSSYTSGRAQLIGGEAQINSGQESWIYVLDNLSNYAPDFDEQKVVDPEQYNQSFTLLLLDVDTQSFVIPSTEDSLTANPRVPFSGRMSGIWGVSGASDQGFLISFSENPTDLSSPVIFLSWYTYDADGNLLWLTGNTNYALGDDEATFDVQYVTNGEFLGGKVADRVSAGTFKLTAYGCNNLNLQYDLNALGLGSDEITLQRFFGIETAGHACRDLMARIESN